MNRREFLIGSCSVGSLALSGCVLDNGGKGGGSETASLETTLFQTESLLESSPSDVGENYIAEQSRKLLKSSIETFSFDCSIDVSIYNIEVPEYVFDTNSNKLDAWDEWLDEEISDSKVSRHANLLLTKEQEPGMAGRAEFPCSCSDPSSGIIYHAEDLYYTPESIVNVDETYSTRNQRFPTVVHEFGHQIGLNHDMGHVVEERPEDRYVVTSAMLGSYVSEFNLNHWNEDIFEEYDREWSVYQNSAFNDRINKEDIGVNF